MFLRKPTNIWRYNQGMILRPAFVCAIGMTALVHGHAQTTRLRESKPKVARILGTAVHPDGTSALGAIEIEPVIAGNPSAVALVSSLDGSFETEEMPAGRYRVGVDLGINRQPDEAYGRTYYPSGPDATKAIEIEIAPGLPGPRIVFTVPKLRPVVRSQGTVVYEDGTRAAGVDVLFSPEGGYSTAQLWTDAKGNFVHTMYGSVAYRIRSRSRYGKYESQEQLVRPADLEKSLLLVLRQIAVQPSNPL